ncbi:MAG: DUF5722 domain-containing protein [Microbacterium sp.]|nr:DUF5722 domain-containing protein [Microbacterium sp.]
MQTRRRRLWKIATIATATTMLLSGFSAQSALAAPAVQQTARIDTVAVGDESITVSGSLGADQAGTTVDVLLSGAQSAATATDAEQFATATASADGTFSAEGPRVRDDGSDGLYGQFSISVDGAVVGGPHYADDLQLTAPNTSDFPEVLDKKGLQVQLTDDAEALGVQHAGINVDLAAIMLNKKNSDDNIVFTSEGQDYYFDRAEVADLDTQIKALSDNGTLVNLIVLVYAHDNDPDSAANVLIHPDASREPGAGPVFGFNTVTAEGIRYTTAAMEFIAGRWSRTDEQFGRAVGFIVGNEVDAQWSWSNSGDKTADEFLNDYSRALRIMSLASRKYYDKARTYTSLTHAWTEPAGPNPDESNPTRFYSVRDVIDKLNQISKATGDFPWYVAQHPYPQDLFKPDFWNDTDATDSIDSKLITFKNIQVLPEYLASEQLLYDGEPRRIILSEQGCNTAGPGDTLTEEAEKLQAACYAYAYYKIRFLPSIDSFILHRHVDHRQEGGLNLGLWAADYSTDFPASPLRHKYSYDVFKYIDTSRSLEVTDFAKPIIGINEWSEVIDGFDPDALDERPITMAVGTRLDGYVREAGSLGDFKSDADGWMPSDNVSEATSVDGTLHVVDAPERFAKQWRGVVKEFGNDAPVARGWLSASVRIPDDSELGANTAAQLRAATSSGQVIEGEARVPADGEYHTVSLELPRAVSADTVTGLKVRVRGTGTSEPETSFDIGSVSRASQVGGSKTANVSVTAQTDSAELVGSTLTVRLTNLDADSLRGVVRIPARCGDFAVRRGTARIGKTPYGDVATVTFTVSGVRGEAATLCVSLGGETLKVPAVVPAPVEHAVYDFESDAQGWSAGDGVESVARVGSIANGPGAPRGGSGALEATSKPAPATSRRIISVAPEKPLDLSDAQSIYVWANSYGGAPGATGYVATFTLTGADGTTVVHEDTVFSPDKWNLLSVDVGDWSSKNAVTSIAVSFAALGSNAPEWSPRFQIDDVGYFTS